MKIFSRQYLIGSRCVLGKEGPNLSNWRLYFLFFLAFLFALAVFLKLYYLQVFSFEKYRLLSEDQHTIFEKLFPKRGEIFLKERNSLYPGAVNREAKLAYAVPKEMEDYEKTADELSQILGLNRDELEEKFSNREDMYELLKRRLSDEEIEKIKNLKMEGVHLADETYRYYPSGELASSVLGFVGWKDNKLVGRYGVESFYEDKLRGEDGLINQNRDTMGRWITIGDRKISEAKNGDTLVLTIDRVVQYETEKIIKSAVEKFEAKDGIIIVIEPSTGKVISLASYPNFDPNNYSKVEDASVFRNLAVSVPYECGSVFKPFVMAAALDQEKINPETTYVDMGFTKEAGFTIKNAEEKVYGRQTMTQVLENSINTGAIYAEKLVGNKDFADYLKRFGFGETTGVGIFGESTGNINNLKDLRRDIQFFTASFGQGITVTPMQLVNAYAAMANGGILMKPQIIDKIVHYDGSEEMVESEEIRRVITEKAALQIGQMLRSVVVNGHGKRADVPGYLVAGKTGTAQIASTKKKGYEEELNVGSFAGFAPLDKPRFAILVKMENPKAVEWAESSAAPTFGELMKFLLEYYNIEPTEDYTQAQMNQFSATHNLSDLYMQNKEKERLTEEANKKLPDRIDMQSVAGGEEELKEKNEQL